MVFQVIRDDETLTCEEVWEFNGQNNGFLQGLFGSFESSDIVPLDIWFLHDDGPYTQTHSISVVYISHSLLSPRYLSVCLVTSPPIHPATCTRPSCYLSIHSSVYLSNHPYCYLSIHPSLLLTICPFIQKSVQLIVAIICPCTYCIHLSDVFQSVCSSSIQTSICLSTNIVINLSVYPSSIFLTMYIHPSTWLFIYPSYSVFSACPFICTSSI